MSQASVQSTTLSMFHEEIIPFFYRSSTLWCVYVLRLVSTHANKKVLALNYYTLTRSTVTEAVNTLSGKGWYLFINLHKDNDEVTKHIADRSMASNLNSIQPSIIWNSDLTHKDKIRVYLTAFSAEETFTKNDVLLECITYYMLYECPSCSCVVDLKPYAESIYECFFEQETIYFDMVIVDRLMAFSIITETSNELIKESLLSDDKHLVQYIDDQIKNINIYDCFVKD